MFYIKTSFCIVAAGRSVYKHFGHIQVQPTYKVQTRYFFTHIYIFIHGFFGVLFNNALNFKFIHGRRHKNFIQVSRIL